MLLKTSKTAIVGQVSLYDTLRHKIIRFIDIHLVIERCRENCAYRYLFIYIQILS